MRELCNECVVPWCCLSEKSLASTLAFLGPVPSDCRKSLSTQQAVREMCPIWGVSALEAQSRVSCSFQERPSTSWRNGGGGEIKINRFLTMCSLSHIGWTSNLVVLLWGVNIVITVRSPRISVGVLWSQEVACLLPADRHSEFPACCSIPNKHNFRSVLIE